MKAQAAMQAALTDRLKATLPAEVVDRFIGGTHTRRFEDNLLPNVRLDQIRVLRTQLELGSGGELRPTRTGKRPAHAPYSSAALAINAFGPWLGRERDLTVAGLTAFCSLDVEHKVKIAHGGGTANLDVWLEGDSLVVGIESKLTEHLAPHEPVDWKAPYETREMAELLDDRWHDVLERSLRRVSQPRFLGLEQLLKHVLAMRSLETEKEQHLVYCYWTADPDASTERAEHQDEVTELLDLVRDANPRFHAITYADLFEDWAGGNPDPWVSEHVRLLLERYSVEF